MVKYGMGILLIENINGVEKIKEYNEKGEVIFEGENINEKKNGKVK